MRRLTLIAVCVLLVAAGRDASACTCIQSGPACQAFWKTDVVLDATVQAIEALATEPAIAGTNFRIPEKLVKLRVTQAWKGAQTGDLDVITASEGSACGF